MDAARIRAIMEQRLRVSCNARHDDMAYARAVVCDVLAELAQEFRAHSNQDCGSRIGPLFHAGGVAAYYATAKHLRALAAALAE